MTQKRAVANLSLFCAYPQGLITVCIGKDIPGCFCPGQIWLCPELLLLAIMSSSAYSRLHEDFHLCKCWTALKPAQFVKFSVGICNVELVQSLEKLQLCEQGRRRTC